MVPPTILSNLSSLRTRERLLTFAWGSGMLAGGRARAVDALLRCRLADRSLARHADDGALCLLGVQAVTAFVAAFCFCSSRKSGVCPMRCRALGRSQASDFDHRLISAVQLNAPNAKLRRHVERARRRRHAMKRSSCARRLRQRCRSSTLEMGRLVLAPIVLLMVIPLAVSPGVSFALLARQTLADVEIPRSVYLQSVSAEVWPMNESIKIRYRVTGEWTDVMIGTVRVTPLGERGDAYPLVYSHHDDKGAIFEADVQPATANITYLAWLYDGRTKTPSEMKVVPRPTVIENMAWILLPAYCGKRPDGGRYEQPQGRGVSSASPAPACVCRRRSKEIKEACPNCSATNGRSRRRRGQKSPKRCR